jgi:hypothetical protein
MIVRRAAELLLGHEFDDPPAARAVAVCRRDHASHLDAVYESLCLVGFWGITAISSGCSAGSSSCG